MARWQRIGERSFRKCEDLGLVEEQQTVGEHPEGS